MESESSFYLTLPSNTTTTFVNNKPQSYRVQLAKPISLEVNGKWLSPRFNIHTTGQTSQKNPSLKSTFHEKMKKVPGRKWIEEIC